MLYFKIKIHHMKVCCITFILIFKMQKIDEVRMNVVRLFLNKHKYTHSHFVVGNTSQSTANRAQSKFVQPLSAFHGLTD